MKPPAARWRLTGRGVTMLVAGAAIAAVAARIGEPDVLWIGLLLMLLPAGALVVVGQFRPRLKASRGLQPADVPLGASCRVTLDTRNTADVSFTAATFRDQAPFQAALDAQFLVAPGFGMWRQMMTYDLPATQRGHWRLGPTLATVNDPLGLATRTWPVLIDEPVLRITPRVWELSQPGDAAAPGSAGDPTPSRVGLAGQDDVLVREHRHGDDLRRVHWRLSAKVGELMVRLEEHPSDPAVTLLVDNRAAAHFGDGADSTLEWAISFVASVATRLLAGRYQVTIASAERELIGPGDGEAAPGEQHMLDVLTDLLPCDDDVLSADLAGGRGDNRQQLLAVTGLLRARDAAILTHLGSRMDLCTALVPEPWAFGAGAPLAAEHEAACRTLLDEGWVLGRYGPGTPVPDAWGALVGHEGHR